MFRKVENKGRYKTAQGYYWHIRDKEIDYLFTDSALQEAEKRAGKNPEDIPNNYGPVRQDSYFIGLATGLVAGLIIKHSFFACTAASYFIDQWIIGN
jgi:hypothetical protein